jgi:hypothetical protein
VIFVSCRSPIHWTYTKRRLAFCTLSQDGADEGALRLHRLPTNAEATLIRQALGIRTRQKISEQTRDRLKAYAFKRKPRNKASREPRTAANEFSVPEPTGEPAPILEPGLAK